MIFTQLLLSSPQSVPIQLAASPLGRARAPFLEARKVRRRDDGLALECIRIRLA